MTTNEFTDTINTQLDICRDVLTVKAKEYATGDRLHNFKCAAGMMECSPEEALAGMMAKHTISIYDMCRSGKDYPIELWNEKITDVDYQEAYTGSRIDALRSDLAVEDIEEFFYSDWFLGMCNIDPEWLIQELRKQCLRHQEQNRRASRYKRLDDIFMEV